MPKQEPTARSILDFKIAMVAAAAAGLMLAAPQIADACTRVLWNTNKLAVVVGRTMDWPESTQPILTLLPRGMSRDGGRAGPQVAVPDNPARWTSRYGSLVTSIYGIGTADGLNERGLGAHMLYLQETDFGPRDRNKPGLQAGLWAQYALETRRRCRRRLLCSMGFRSSR
jgi:penicillin V acylase-like amidase (Ntn superfamily)